MKPSDLVSFIPMGDVSDSGHWMTKRTKPLKSVRQGFTPFANGDVLFAKITPCMENGKGAHVVGLANGVGFGSTEFHVLRPKPEADARFIFHHTQHRALRSAAEAAMTGSAGQKRVPTEFFHKRKVYAPDKEEQSRIADILDTLDTQIQKTEALIAKLAKIKEGLLHDLLTRGIDQNGQLRPGPDQAPDFYKTSAIGLIPKEWHLGTISDYVHPKEGIKPGPFGSSITKSIYRRSGYKIYGQEQVIRADHTFGDYYIDQTKYSELADFSVQPFDLLISLVGTIGKVLIIPETHEKGVINPRLMRLRPNKHVCDPEFLGQLLTSSFFTRKLIALAGGGTMPVINKRIIQDVTLPLIPISEQIQIRSRLLCLLGRLESEEALLAKSRAQKSGLMDDLLTGKVRVTPLLKDVV
ncbi:restriction endonuclease subunit S [Marinobacter salarius]|nr:restriction endonuclease subunit S [Marinobacter salarius]